jgi:hypothetical protein
MILKWIVRKDYMRVWFRFGPVVVSCEDDIEPLGLVIDGALLAQLSDS